MPVEPTTTARPASTKGWDCNPNNWYKDSEGKDIEPKSNYLGPQTPGQQCDPSDISEFTSTDAVDQYCTRVGGRIGSAYNLRDVDCYDNLNSVVRPLLPSDCKRAP